MWHKPKTQKFHGRGSTIGLNHGDLSNRRKIMGKGQNSKKKTKKEPQKTMKEKKQAKREKENEKKNPGILIKP
jgi:hypothetical protein